MIGDLEIEYAKIIDTSLNIRLLFDVSHLKYQNSSEMYGPLKTEKAIEPESIELKSEVPVNIDKLKVRAHIIKD